MALIPGKWNAVATVLDLAGALRAMEALWRQRKDGHPAIFSYHTVGDPSDRSFPFDLDMISATEDEFDAQVKFLKGNFDLVNFSKLADNPDSTDWRGKVILTFDDAYRHSRIHAYPILLKHRTTAVFFLPAASVLKGDVMWFDRVSHGIRTSKKEHLRFDDVGDFPLTTVRERQTALRAVKAKLKMLSQEERASRIRDLFIDLDCPEDHPPSDSLLRLGDVKEMIKGGMEIGSHSMTHPILSQVSDPELHVEIVESKRDLEAAIGARLWAFAYPNGTFGTFGRREMELARKAGYAYAVANNPGRPGREQNRYSLPRIPVISHNCFSRFRLALNIPSLY